MNRSAITFDIDTIRAKISLLGMVPPAAGHTQRGRGASRGRRLLSGFNMQRLNEDGLRFRSV